MAKWHGKIGFSTQVETEPSVYEQQIVEKSYYGEMTKASRRWVIRNEINDDLNISNILIIYADPYATDHFGDMTYVVYLNKKWKIQDASFDYPKITLSLGGLYNEDETS